MSLPGYTIVIQQDDEGDFMAYVLELHGCMTHGATINEALKRIEEAKTAWIESAIQAGDDVPLPGDASQPIWNRIVHEGQIEDIKTWLIELSVSVSNLRRPRWERGRIKKSGYWNEP